MTGRTRREEAFARVASGTRNVSPTAASVRASIQCITEMPQWRVLLDFLDHEERKRTAQSDEEDAGALLRAAGRRSLLRELERLDERVIDDDRSDQRE